MISKSKEFAINILNGFDELARPEIQNALMAKIWNYIRNYSHKVILKKPDEEIQIKLLKIYKIFNEYFTDLDMAIEIKKSEALGSIPVPNVGKMAEIKKIMESDKIKALELIKELGL
jgi:hypothetical protein